MANFNKLPSNNEKNTYLYRKTHSTNTSRPSTSAAAAAAAAASSSGAGTSRLTASERYKLNPKNESLNLSSVLATFPRSPPRPGDEAKNFKHYHRHLNDNEPDLPPAIYDESSCESMRTQQTIAKPTTRSIYAKSAAAKSTAAKSTAAKLTAAKLTAAKPTAEPEHRYNAYSFLRQTLKPEEVIRPRLRAISESADLPSTRDPFSYLKRTAINWEKRVRKSLETMCAQLKVNPRGHARTKSDRQQVESKWDLLSNYSVDLVNYRPVFAPKDFFEAVLSIHGPVPTSYNSLLDPPRWEFTHIALPSKTLKQLYTTFSDLLRQDFRDVPQMSRHAVNQKDGELCKRILRKGSASLTYRANLWTYALDAMVSKDRYDEWKRLKARVIEMDHVVDKLIFKDVQLTASNDDQYFVFEDVLYQILLCFTRDHTIAEEINADYPSTKIKAFEDIPCGIVPYYGISMYAAPFCYLYDTSESMYFAFRQFYMQYCYKLTTISTDPQGIVSLCLLFERLLIAHEPELWSHFRDMEVKPLRIVFKWLMRAFAGHLPPDQLLVLYDLIVGYENLELLPLFALIVLSFRKETLMQVQTYSAVDSILADFTSIKVLPLIRLALCSE